VPVNIVRRKGVKLDGSNPVLLTGYGGYGISIEPGFSVLRRIWIDHGGVYAQANLRGGGEFGEQWHREGMLTSKQNVFDDFAAAMQYMIDAGYTSPEKLAIVGGSNGGLLMGAMITQHPELCRAVLSSVGIYDMLRVELTPNGEFNIPEFGTVKNLDQFRALYAYSPYHNVKDGTAYPSVLFLTGANDPRVDPMHSRKMTARLQAASSSGRPVLLRTSSKTGHGSGTPLTEQIDRSVHYHAFLLNELGL
jgi:prolyl oligopeptidase